MKIEKNCKVCNKKFSVYKYRNNTAKFCSKQCTDNFKIGEKNPKFGLHRYGQENPMYGKKQSEIAKRKIGEKQKGRIRSDEEKKKLSLRFLGNNNPNYGKIISDKIRKKISLIRIENGLSKLDKNPNWQGGKSFEEYGLEFNDDLKNKIRERDDHTCNICLVKDDFSNFPVHHIDYNKKNNKDHNLITLCATCHLKTNFNRNNWMLWFNGLMFEKFKNKYNLITNERREII